MYIYAICVMYNYVLYMVSYICIYRGIYVYSDIYMYIDTIYVIYNYVFYMVIYICEYTIYVLYNYVYT